MILHVSRDDYGYIFEPHGEEPVAWYCDAEGGDILRAAGWRPYEMHRVSVYVFDSLCHREHLRILYDLVPSNG
jgi:hypothetical protein